MPSDDEKESSGNRLVDREHFLGWKRKMRLTAKKKGDTQGVFDEDGTKGIYAAIPVGPAGNAARKKWRETTEQLIGEIGTKIDNATLEDVWSSEYERIQTQGAGPPDHRPFAVALAMAAREVECARATSLGRGMARTQFILALQSFIGKDTQKNGQAHADTQGGFVPYVDRIA